MAVIPLPLPDGRTMLLASGGRATCRACGTVGDVAQVSVGRNGDADPDLLLDLCGGCIAEGLAILLGRRHVQMRGALDDLRAPSGNATPIPATIACEPLRFSRRAISGDHFDVPVDPAEIDGA